MAALRLSTTPLIIFVEGKEGDACFYGHIAKRFSEEHEMSFEIRRATELPNNALAGSGGSGGKRTLNTAAGAWDRYKNRHLSKWKNAKTLVFCVDKDVEDLVGIDSSAKCLIRTPSHSVENHLIRSVDLQNVLERVLSLSPGELNGTHYAQEEWFSDVSALWLDWLTFCVVALRLEADGVTNYSSGSLFNRPYDAKADEGSIAAFKARMQKQTALSVSEFDVYWTYTRDLLRWMIEHGQHDRIFKGKWYIDCLFAQLSSSGFGDEARAIGKTSISAAIRASFGLRSNDYEYYLAELTRVIADASDNGVPLTQN